MRVHRAGGGAPFTGLEPAGLSEGPVIPVAEGAIEKGSPDEPVKLLWDTAQCEPWPHFSTGRPLARRLTSREE
jgi:hypothetical protein